MIRVAICEDNRDDAAHLAALLRAHPPFGMQYQLSRFDSGAALLFEYGEANASPFDLLLLDIQMPQPDGFETARQIRRLDREVLILFVTVHDQKPYLRDAYRLHPFDYLIKPLTARQLHQSLDEAVEKLYLDREKRLEFRTTDGCYSIPLRNILYLEVLRLTLTVHMENREIAVRMSLQSALAQCGPSFVQISRWAAVNRYHVLPCRSAARELLLSDGTRLPYQPGAAAGGGAGHHGMRESGMDRVELAGSILIMAAELGLLLAFFTGLFGRRTTACRARALVAVTVAASRLLMLAVIRYAPLGSLFLLTADLLVVSLLFPVRMRKRVLFLLLYYFSLAASEVLGMLLAVRILGSGEDFLGTNSAAEMLAQIFSKGFLLLLLLPSLQRRRSIRVLWLRCREALRAALAPLLCCLVLVLLIPHLWQPGNRPLLIALGIIALSLAAVNHLSLDRWLIRADLHRVRSSLDTQRHLIEGWLRRLKAGREGVRRLYHDLRGHFVHLLGLLRRGQSNQAVTYLEELDHTLQSLRTEPYTGNPVVDALLSHAQGVCRSREIRLDCRGQLPEDLSIQDSDLVGLVGNALDNAVKASPRGGTITVQCSYRAGWLRFRVENPVAATIPKGQGLGLSIMRDIVQRYAGWLEVCTEPKRYRITIYVHDGETESS